MNNLFPRNGGGGGERGGFSLIEILVATVILAFLVVLLGTVVRQVGSAWISGEARTQNRENGRAITDFMGRELRAALAPVDPDGKSLQLILDPPGIPAAYKNPDALFWQAPLATDRTYGDIAEIGYFVRWDTSTPNHPKALLCRLFVNPAIPDPDNPDQSIPNPAFRIYEDPEAWITGSLLDEAAPADKTNSYRGLLAENVLGLWIKPLDRDGKLIASPPGGGGFDSREGYSEPSESPGGAAIRRSLPATVEVSFVMVDSRAANRIDTAMQTAIVKLTGQAANAADFVEKAAQNESMTAIRASLRACSEKIYLLNAR